MSEKKTEFVLEGKTYQLDEEELSIIQRLRDAIRCVAEGVTESLGIVENSGDDVRRMFYVNGDDHLDNLMQSVAGFGVLLAATSLRVQGNAPPSNRSTAKH